MLALLGIVLIAAPARAEIDRSRTRAEMAEIYASLSTLLPLAVDDEAFRSPEARERIVAALDQLATGTDHVASHVAGDDRRIHYLASSLSREARDARARFEEQRYEGAQFLVRRFSDFCVACHTRVPSADDSPLARGFVSDDALARLPAPQRASILVATRRFEDAMAVHETIFAAKDVAPAEMLPALTEYLRVTLRVKDEGARARATLARFASRPDLWSNLRGDVTVWIAALDAVAGQPPAPPSVARARALLAEADRVTRYPTDRRGLVQQLLASSELHRYLEGLDDQTGAEVAEAYLLLGLIETRTRLDSLVAEGRFYLETAIRLAPHGPVGREAFALLEEATVMGWTGSGGEHLPEDARRHLAELRALVEAPGPAGAR